MHPPYTVESPFLVRAAGLPASALTDLESPATVAAVHAVLTTDRWLATTGDHLADALHGVIGRLRPVSGDWCQSTKNHSRPLSWADADPQVDAGSGGRVKPGLVGLRRALHGGRRPRAAEWSPAVRGALLPDLLAGIEGWLARLDGRERLVTELAATVARERERTLRALLGTVADRGFRHGVAQSSPALSAELEKWLVRCGGGTDASRPGRQVLTRLARYVSRAAAKTSPYSTFTTVGAGIWTTGTADVPVRFTAGPPPCGLLEFHGVVLHGLELALLRCPELRPALRVRVNPSATLLDGRLQLLGPPPAEAIASVAAVPEVREILRILDDGPCTLAALHTHLHTHATTPTPAPAPAPAPMDHSPGSIGQMVHPRGVDGGRTDGGGVDGGGGMGGGGRVGAFLERLVEVGLLELQLPVDDQCDDRFGALAGWLRVHGGPRWAATAEECAALSGLLRGPTGLDDVAEHGARLRAIRHRVSALRRVAGLPAPSDERIDADLVHEHSVFPAPVAEAGLPAWRAALDDLDAIRRWMALHDPALPLRVALGVYVGETFGAGASVPFVRFHRALLGTLAGTAGTGGTGGTGGTAGSEAAADLRAQLRPQPATVDSQLGELRELDLLRGKAIDELLGGRLDPDGVLRVAPGVLADAAAGLPAAVRPAESVAWYLQRGGADRVVLNQAISGHGRGRGRWLHLIARAGGTVPMLPAGLPASGAGNDGGDAGRRVVADSSGTFGHPLNLRTPLVSHALDYPFTVVDGDRRPRIALRDLVVTHDPASGLLALRTTGGLAVTPAHTGMMSEYLLPIGLQLLIRGFGITPTLFQPAKLLAVQPLPDQVCATPRIEVGRVTLRRASWSAPADLVPRREPGASDARHLVRLHGWLAEHGIPRRCFVVVNPPVPAGQPWLTAVFTKTRKPLYVDLGSPLQLDVFERLVAGPAQRVLFREPLPALSRADPRVTEFVVETAGAP